MIQLYALAALFLVVAGFGAGWKVNEWRHDAQELAITQAVDQAKAAFSDENGKMGDRLEKKLANLRIVNKTINNEVQREIREKTVYLDANCAIPESGVRLLNSARGYITPAPGSEPPAALPPAPASGAKDAPSR